MGAMVCGAVMAKPPTHPLSEGRELDPVTRDHYLVPRAADSAQDRAEQDPARGDSVLEFLYDFILHSLTIPLGTVQMPDDQR